MVRNEKTKVCVANFTLPGQGAFSGVVFDMSTYGVTFVREASSVRLKINAWDKQDEAGEHAHRVKRKLLLEPD